MLASLRRLWCGGAPLDITCQRRAEAAIHAETRIVQVWGMTECGWIITFLDDGERDLTGAVGRSLPGYLDDEIATTEAFADFAWLKTGDVACIRDELVYIVDYDLDNKIQQHLEKNTAMTTQLPCKRTSHDRTNANVCGESVMLEKRQKSCVFKPSSEQIARDSVVDVEL